MKDELPPNEHPGPHLLRIRQARGWTQDELAERSGVQKSVISRIERQEHVGRLGSLAALAHALGVRLADWFGSGGAAHIDLGAELDDGCVLTGPSVVDAMHGQRGLHYAATRERIVVGDASSGWFAARAATTSHLLVSIDLGSQAPVTISIMPRDVLVLRPTAEDERPPLSSLVVVSALDNSRCELRWLRLIDDEPWAWKLAGTQRSAPLCDWRLIAVVVEQRRPFAAHRA